MYAKWNNTITYVLNGGTQAPNQVETYHPSNPQSILSPSRSSFDFAGWYENSGFTGTKITSTSLLSGNVTLYARWVPIYTISYVLNGGNDDDTLVRVFSEVNVQTLVDPSNNHDPTFNGWYNNNSRITSTSQLSGDTTLTADWTSGINNTDFSYQTNRFTANNLASRLLLADFTTDSIYQYTRGAASTTINSVQIFVTYTTGNASPTLQCRIVGGSSSGTVTLTFNRRQTNYEVSGTINLSTPIQKNSSYTVSCYSYSGDGNGNNKARITGFAFIINP